MNKKLTIILNPASGKKDSILWSINNAFYKKGVNWDIRITQKNDDAYEFARKELKNKPKYLGVYGGDGTVTEVAKALYKTETSLFIIPGGTNNVIAKELGISTNVDDALSLFTLEKIKTESIDMGIFQNEPFILRIETGLIARIVKNTKRGSKQILGQLSYPLELLPQLNKQKIRKYKIVLNNKKQIDVSGISLVVANVGNVGIEGYSIVPNSTVKDGMLDIVLFQEKPLKSFLSWFKSAMTSKKPDGPMEHWRAKKVKVMFEGKQTIICDDNSLQTDFIEAEIAPKSLKVIVP